MTAAGPDDVDLDDALAEAVGSLRESYPSLDLPAEPVGLHAFVGLLDDPGSDADVRRDVARVVGMLAERFPGELSDVAPGLVDRLDDDAVRAHLLRALGYVSDADPDAVLDSTGAVVAQLGADDPASVRNATWVLSNLAAADPGAVEAAFPDLVDLLSHDDEEVRRRAARAVAAAPESLLASEDEPREQLLEMLARPGLHRSTERALVAVAPAYGEELVGELVARIRSGRPAAREHAASTIEGLADAHPALVEPHWPELLEVVRADDDHQVRRSVAAALGAVAAGGSNEDLLGGLVGLTDHEDAFARRYGCLALGPVAVERAPAAALSALADARTDEAAVVGGRADQTLTAAAREHPEAVAAVAPDLVGRGGDDA